MGRLELLSVVDIEYIRKKHYLEGWSIREISKRLDVSRQSVRKALASAERKTYTLRKPKVCHVMDGYRDIITAWLESDKTAPKKQRHTAKRIFDRLCQEYQFTGSDRTVRHYVQKLREQIEEPSIEPYFILTADPGEMAQVDWGHAHAIIDDVDTIVHLFCLRFRASGVSFVWASLHERMEAFLEGHVRAFTWLGGIPAKIVYDNLSTAVRKILKDHERDLHERFVTLRSHYLFESIFCNPYAGNEKGDIENLVGTVRRNALTPVPKVKTIDELNTHILAWCERQRSLHQQKWEAEKAALRPIPVATFRPCTSWVLPVNKLSLVTYDRNRYSVPTEYMGQNLRVDAYSDRLEIWHLDQKVAEQVRLFGRNRNSLQLSHYLSALARKPFAVTHAAVVRDLPEPYQQARTLLCEGNPSGYRELVQILLLHREFPADALQEAVIRALDRRRLVADEIRQDLLNAQAVTCRHGNNITHQLTDVRVPVGRPNIYNVLMEGVSA